MSKTDEAVERLASVIENGHLLVATGGADLLFAAADEIERLRGEPEPARVPLDALNAEHPDVIHIDHPEDLEFLVGRFSYETGVRIGSTATRVKALRALVGVLMGVKAGLQHRDTPARPVIREAMSTENEWTVPRFWFEGNRAWGWIGKRARSLVLTSEPVGRRVVLVRAPLCTHQVDM